MTAPFDTLRQAQGRSTVVEQFDMLTVTPVETTAAMPVPSTGSGTNNNRLMNRKSLVVAKPSAIKEIV